MFLRNVGILPQHYTASQPENRDMSFQLIKAATLYSRVDTTC